MQSDVLRGGNAQARSQVREKGGNYERNINKTAKIKRQDNTMNRITLVVTDKKGSRSIKGFTKSDYTIRYYE